MDFATVIGVLIGSSAIIWSILLGGGALNAFWNFPSAALVFGGMLAAALINYSLKDIAGVAGMVKSVFLQKEKSSAEVILQFVRFAELARKEGIAALESATEKLDDKFIKKGLQLAIEGMTPELLEKMLEIERLNLKERHKCAQSICESLGAYAIAFGIAGTLAGLILLLKTSDDLSQIGSGVATALIATFYGIVLSNLFFSPMAGRLKRRAQNDVLAKAIAVKGILGIQAGDNPRTLEEKLKACLLPGARSALEKD